jgi:hypothetical protein
MRFSSLLYRLLFAAIVGASLPAVAVCTSVRSGSGYGSTNSSSTPSTDLSYSQLTDQMLTLSTGTTTACSNASPFDCSVYLYQINTSVSAFSLTVSGSGIIDAGVFGCDFMGCSPFFSDSTNLFTGSPDLTGGPSNPCVASDLTVNNVSASLTSNVDAVFSSTGDVSNCTFSGPGSLTFFVAEQGGIPAPTISSFTTKAGTAPAPEPSSVALMLLGVGLLFVMRKRIGQGLPKAS